MPPRSVGILSLDDLLERRFISPIKLGLNILLESLQADMEIHNRLTTDMIGTYADVTDDIRRLYGAGTTIDFNEVDEFGRSHTQKVSGGAVVEFPLKQFQAAVGWTADYFARKTVADFAQTQLAVQGGHQLAVRRDLQRAMYLSANYTFNDRLDTGIDIGVKRFLNADSAPIPNGPNGQIFDPTTHTHYLATATLTDVGAAALVSTVLEHFQKGPIRVFINVADEAAWRALTNFKPLIDTRFTLGTSAIEPQMRLDPFSTDDRAIGLYGAAEVWIKPWTIAGYAVALCMAPNAPKPLAIRVPRGTSQVALSTVAQNVMFPLQAEYMESRYGVGVWTRTNGAVYDFGHGSYTDPTIP